MKEETLAFFLNGSKKSLHLSSQNGINNRGFMVGTEIVSSKAVPPQISGEIRRVYYTNNSNEFVLSICEMDLIIGIYSYNLDTFEKNLLAKFPDFNHDSISEMYFSLFYDAILDQFHVLCGPKTERNGYIWCVYDIANQTNAANMIELSDTPAKPPNIQVCDGQRFIFNGHNCMRFESESLIVYAMPDKYKYKSMNDMLSCENIVYVRNENRMFLFGGHTNALLWTDIWCLDLNNNKHQ